MTSNLGSEEIRAASPQLHKLVAATENRHEQYLKAIGEFNKELYPVLKGSLKRDEFLGRINQIVVFLPLNDQEVSNEATVISDVIDDPSLSPDRSSH
jgi:ATP-dependent Clp protease ATP-binding subunit ClpB